VLRKDSRCSTQNATIGLAPKVTKRLDGTVSRLAVLAAQQAHPRRIGSSTEADRAYRLYYPAFWPFQTRIPPALHVDKPVLLRSATVP